jgi:hypothetical protein
VEVISSKRTTAAFVLALTLVSAWLFPASALAAKSRVSVSFGVSGNEVRIKGSVPAGVARKKAWTIALQQKVGRRWVRRAGFKLHPKKHGKTGFGLTWNPAKTPGDGLYRVAVLAGKRTLAASKPKRLSFSGGGGKAPAPKVDRIKASQILKLPSKDSPKLVLSGAHSFAPGQFLATAPSGKAPEGFLLKVVSSQVKNGKTTVTVKAASLYEAVPNGQIAASLGDLSSATPQNRDAAVLSRAMATASSADSDVPFDKKVQCQGGGEMTLTGALHASLAPNFALSWHTFLGAPTGVDRARATVDASLSAEASADVSGTASCKMDPITLLDPHWTVLVEVGPVPVPLTVDIPIKLSASASVSGKVHVKASAGVRGALGLEYHDGDISGVHEFSSDASLEHSVQASAEAEAKIGPDIAVEAGWHVPVLGELAVKVDADVASGLKLTYDSNASPPGKLCVPLTVEGSIDLEIPVKDLDPVGPKKLIDTNIKCVDFGGSTLHWEGSIGANWHTDFSKPGPENETGSYSGSASWHVDSTGPDGPPGGPLDYTGSWTAHDESNRSCPGGGTTQFTREGGGSGTQADGTNSLMIDSSPAYGFTWELYTGGPDGTLTDTYTDCTGATGVFTNEDQPIECIGWLNGSMAAMPRNGTHVVGTLTSSEPCISGGGYSSSGGYTISFDLTVTCSDGSAPDADWKCS